MEQIKKNSKFIVQIDNDFINRDEYNESEIDDEDEINEFDDYEYVINSIKDCLINYVDTNYIPLCEYITYENIEDFLTGK